MKELKPLVPRHRPPLGIVYSRASEQVDLVRKLRNTSIIAVLVSNCLMTFQWISKRDTG